MKFKITERGINFLLIFILGFLVGVALKSEAQKRVTIGFNDYLVPQYKQDIDLTAPLPDQSQGQNQSQPAENDQEPVQQNSPQNGPMPDSGSNQ
jgi:hypothetical protein